MPVDLRKHVAPSSMTGRGCVRWTDPVTFEPPV